MFKNLLRGALPAACLAAFTVAAPAQTASSGSSTASTPPLKVGFVYVTPVGQAGWTFQHDLGRQAMEKALGAGVKSTVVEAVAEGPDSERVMRDLAAQGHQLIFATSFGYLEPALRVAADFPDVKFEHAGGYKTAVNLGTYNARFYEGRWLAGYLAGKSSQSGTAGYVAGFPVPEVIQGINAFTLGMQAANPKAQVKVLWLNAWFDPAREREAALSLISAGADVLTNHSASPAVPQAAEEKGVMLVAYHSDMSRFAPKAQLAAVVANWGGFYTQAAQAVMAQRWKPVATLGGFKDGMVELAALSPRLPKALREDVLARRRDIAAGKLLPFGGRLVDQSGRVRQDKGALGDEAIAHMDWFVQGVQGTLPASAR